MRSLDASLCVIVDASGANRAGVELSPCLHPRRPNAAGTLQARHPLRIRSAPIARQVRFAAGFKWVHLSAARCCRVMSWSTTR